MPIDNAAPPHQKPVESRHPCTPSSWAAGGAEAVLDGMLDAVLVFDADGVIVFANRACGRLCGRAPRDLVGQPIRTLLPASLRPAPVPGGRACLQAPGPERFGERPVVLMQRPDGTSVAVEFSLTPRITAAGSYVTSVLREIHAATPRMGGERHLELSELAARMGSWEEDAVIGAVQWSPGLFDLLGLPPGSVRPSTEAFLACIHPHDVPLLLERRNSARLDGGEWFVEVRLVPRRVSTEAHLTPTGPDRETTVSILGRVEVDADGRVVASTGTVQDISTRAVLERQLHVSKARLQTAFDGAPIGMALVDARPGHPPMRLMANQALAELTGLTMAELLQTSVVACVHPEDRARFTGAIRQVATGEVDAVRSVEARIVRPDGEERSIATSATLARDPDGTPAYIIAHVLDTTDRQRVEAESRARAARDARIAAVLQEGMHPYVPRRVGPVRIAHRYRSAGDGERVGGDWTDVFALPTGRIGLVVGDVAGHGVEAATTMTRLRVLVQMLATSGASPAGVMRRLNDVLHESDLQTEINMATLVYAQLDTATGMLLYCSAGHLPMLVLPRHRRHRRRAAVPVPAIGGPPIGVVPGLRYTEQTVALEPGDMLIGYTDGLVERRDQDIDESLLDLRNRINALDPATMNDVESLADTLIEQAPTHPSEDDIAVIVLHFDLARRGRPSPAPVDHAGPPIHLSGRTSVPGTAFSPPAQVDLRDVAVPPNRWTRLAGG